MDIRLDGKVALVTGGSKGIGAGIARALAEAGADVTITANTDLEGAEETAAAVRALGRRCEVVKTDVGVEAEVDALFARHQAALGRIDILVANAGISPKGTPVHETTLAQFDQVLKTNLYGPFFCAREAAKLMLAQGDGGRIVMISSVHEEACTAGGWTLPRLQGGPPQPHADDGRRAGRARHHRQRCRPRHDPDADER
jgi:glucose 1-dehydrogenase